MSTIEKKSVKVGKYVNNAHVDTLIRNYKKERWVQNSERIGKEDSLSTWYTTDELEEFLERVKIHGADGIRFYFGAYSADYADKPEYATRQTIVMVATRSKEVNGVLAHKDVYITDANGAPKILAYNAGAMCPPFCPPPGGLGRSSLGVTLIDRGEKGVAII